MEGLAQHSCEYTQLRVQTLTSKLGESLFRVEILAHRWFLSKCYIGLVTGTFLTLRNKNNMDGATGEVLICPLCQTPAYQEHFLNRCPINRAPRAILSHAIPPEFRIEVLRDGDCFSFYLNARSLSLSLLSNPLDDEDPVPAGICFSLAKAASEMAASFASNTMALFSTSDNS